MVSERELSLRKLPTTSSHATSFLTRKMAGCMGSPNWSNYKRGWTNKTRRSERMNDGYILPSQMSMTPHRQSLDEALCISWQAVIWWPFHWLCSIKLKTKEMGAKGIEKVQLLTVLVRSDHLQAYQLQPLRYHAEPNRNINWVNEYSNKSWVWNTLNFRRVSVRSWMYKECGFRSTTPSPPSSMMLSIALVKTSWLSHLLNAIML